MPAPRGRVRCSCAANPSRSADDGRYGRDVRGAVPLCDVVEGKEALAAASMWGSQGQAAQVRQRLAPTFMINS